MRFCRDTFSSRKQLRKKPTAPKPMRSVTSFTSYEPLTSNFHRLTDMFSQDTSSDDFTLPQREKKKEDPYSINAKTSSMGPWVTCWRQELPGHSDDASVVELSAPSIMRREAWAGIAGVAVACHTFLVIWKAAWLRRNRHARMRMSFLMSWQRGGLRPGQEKFLRFL